MSKIVALGAVSEVTKSTYPAGTNFDGVKANDPSLGWVYMKSTLGSQVDFAPEG